MGQKLAIDLGTTNTVVACWDAEAEQITVVRIPGISIPEDDERPPLVPSLLYVDNGENGTVTLVSIRKMLG